MIRTFSALPIIAVLAALVGCGSYSYSGSVSVFWRDGGGSDTGEACVCEPVLLAMSVYEEGDARVTAGWWSVVEAPFGSHVALSDTYDPEIVAHFETPGWYTLEYTVEYRLGATTYATSSRLFLYVTASGIG